MAKQKTRAAVTTYGDHDVITPEHKLRKAVRAAPASAADDDPVARAEMALAELSSKLTSWMDSECERLDDARRAVAVKGLTKATKEALFHAAHDIKGEAATFGFPLVAGAAHSLCRLLEYAPDVTRIPIKVIDQHVDAVRAIPEIFAFRRQRSGRHLERASARGHRRVPAARESRPPGRDRADQGSLHRAGMIGQLPL